jgi:selenocysteine-specific translation elongation factor
MAYLIQFKSDLTKGKWISKKGLYSTKSSIEEMLKYLRKFHTNNKYSKKINLVERAKKVDAHKSPYNRMRYVS